MGQKMMAHALQHHKNRPVIQHLGVQDGVRQFSSGQGLTYKTVGPAESTVSVHIENATTELQDWRLGIAFFNRPK